MYLEYKVFDWTGSVPCTGAWVIYIEDSEFNATLTSVSDYRQHNFLLEQWGKPLPWKFSSLSLTVIFCSVIWRVKEKLLYVLLFFGCHKNCLPFYIYICFMFYNFLIVFFWCVLEARRFLSMLQNTEVQKWQLSGEWTCVYVQHHCHNATQSIRKHNYAIWIALFKLIWELSFVFNYSWYFMWLDPKGLKDKAFIYGRTQA